MSAKLFKTPTWDDDVVCEPGKTFNFKKKINNKKKPKSKQIEKEEIPSYEPGRFVKLHRNTESESNGSRKRKLSETQNNGLVSPEKRKKIRKQNDNQDKEPVSSKKKKLKNIPFTKKLSQPDEQDDDTSNQNGNNSFRQALIDNLKGSRFRYLNELLYSKPSNEATGVFQDDPTSFQAYHEGYRQQVQQWPLNPLDRMIKALKRLGQLKIAEVESRFTDIRHFEANIKQCGFDLVHQDVSNNLFYFLNFKKTKMVKKTSKVVKAFSLKPCIYKKR